MKIVYINAVFGILSTGRTNKELLDYMITRGNEACVFYGERKGDYVGACFMGSMLSHKAHALFSRITGKHGHYSRIATSKLLKFLDKYKPDIVHLGNLHGNFISIPMLLKYLGDRDIATVVTLHDCYMYTGGCTHYSKKGCHQWRTQCFKCLYYRENGSWFFDRSRLLFDEKRDGFRSIPRLGVIGVSEWIAKEASESEVLRNAKIITRIYNWVDLDLFHHIESDIKKRLGIQDRPMFLGVASDWSNAKGLDKFINFASATGDQSVFVLVGNMPSDIQLPNNIISVPATKSVVDLVHYYSAADVFLQFSEEETFGKVVAESMACGTPAVVIDSTASPELINENCGALISKSATLDEIKAAIKTLLSMDRTKLAAECRKNAEMNFNKDKNCNEIADLYLKLLN